jgi:hypothetical protein
LEKEREISFRVIGFGRSSTKEYLFVRTEGLQSSIHREMESGGKLRIEDCPEPNAASLH